MKCPICGKDVVIKNKQVGVNEQGNPVFNQYAVCKDCKKQWNLDKKRASKATRKKTTENQESVKPVPAKKEATPKQNPVKKETSAKQNPIKKDASAKQNTIKKETTVKQNPVKKEDNAKQNPIKKDASVKQNPIKKGASEKVESADKEQQKKLATSKQKPRKKAEHAADSQQTSTSNSQNSEKRIAAKQRPAQKTEHKSEAKRNVTDPEASRTKNISKASSSKKDDINNPKLKDTIILDNDDLKLGNIPSENVRAKRERKVKQGYAEMVAADSKNTAKKYENIETDSHDEYEPIVRFRALRVIFGIISILIAGFYAFNSYTSGLFESTTGMTFVILAGCMALSGLLLIILNATNNIFAFLLPMILYLASGLYAFLNRGDDTFLLYSAIVGAAFSVLFIILAISSRGDEEDYDDFDEDEDNDEDDEDWNDDDF